VLKHLPFPEGRMRPGMRWRTIRLLPHGRTEEARHADAFTSSDGHIEQQTH